MINCLSAGIFLANNRKTFRFRIGDFKFNFLVSFLSLELKNFYVFQAYFLTFCDRRGHDIQFCFLICFGKFRFVFIPTGIVEQDFKCFIFVVQLYTGSHRKHETG